MPPEVLNRPTKHSYSNTAYTYFTISHVYICINKYYGQALPSKLTQRITHSLGYSYISQLYPSTLIEYLAIANPHPYSQQYIFLDTSASTCYRNSIALLN